MKILQLGKFYPIRGGVEKVEYDLMKGLWSLGIECDMLCAGKEGVVGDVEISEHGRVMVCPTVVEAEGTTISPSMITKLRRICKEYDVIHVHHPDPMAALALFLSGYKGRVVLHWHSDIVKQNLALVFYKPLQNWLLRRSDRVVCTTPIYMKESPHLTKAQDKALCIPIGIEPVPEVETSKVQQLRERYGNRKMVFSLGRLVYYKGYEFLVRAAQYLDDDTVVLIGGGGPLREELQTHIDSHGLSEKVVLLGRVEDEELPVFYHACDVYCMSSVQRTEAFGIVQIEAMSCGKPLVATNIKGSGVSWVNSHDESGLNAEPCDAEGLAQAINDILRDSETYKRFAEGSKKRFAEWFTVEKMIKSAVELYNGLI